MPRVKLQLAHLKNARLASVEHFKKQKLTRSQSTNTEQLRIDDDQLRIDDDQLRASDTSDTSDIEDGEGVWFWNESVNETDSDLDCSEESDEEEWDGGPRKLDGRSGESRTEKEAVIETQVGMIKWNREGKKKPAGGVW